MMFCMSIPMMFTMSTMITSPLVSVLEQRVAAIHQAGPPAPSGTREHAAYQAKLRRARLALARAKGSHTAEEWDAIVAETAGICVRCGYQHDLERERPCKAYIRPIAAGGTNAADNLQPLCIGCARTKAGEMINWLATWRATQTP